MYGWLELRRPAGTGSGSDTGSAVGTCTPALAPTDPTCAVAEFEPVLSVSVLDPVPVDELPPPGWTPDLVSVGEPPLAPPLPADPACGLPPLPPHLPGEQWGHRS